MNVFLKNLEKEEKTLERQIHVLMKKLENYPKETLHVSISHGKDQFYIAGEAGDKDNKKKKYLKKKDRELAALIVQRDYERKLLGELQRRKHVIETTRKVYKESDPTAVMRGFPLGKQALIEPIFLSKTEYARKWQGVKYEGKKFQENTPEIFTAKGERVRSKSEKIIADTLFRYGVPYRYEYPLELQGYGTIYPDFLVLNSETREEFFWEHLGCMDEEDYCKAALNRIRAYEKNNYFPGKQVILTSETKTMPLDIKVVDLIIQNYLT